jgi:prolyl-tRNA synthetase
MLNTIQQALYDRALAFREENTVDATTYDEIKQVVQDNFVRIWWCGDPEDEVKLKEDTRATTRCIPLEQNGRSGQCAICGKPATEQVILARAY